MDQAGVRMGGELMAVAQPQQHFIGRYAHRFGGGHHGDQALGLHAAGPRHGNQGFALDQGLDVACAVHRGHLGLGGGEGVAVGFPRRFGGGYQLEGIPRRQLHFLGVELDAGHPGEHVQGEGIALHHHAARLIGGVNFVGSHLGHRQGVAGQHGAVDVPGDGACVHRVAVLVVAGHRQLGQVEAVAAAADEVVLQQGRQRVVGDHQAGDAGGGQHGEGELVGEDAFSRIGVVAVDLIGPLLGHGKLTLCAIRPVDPPGHVRPAQGVGIAQGIVAGNAEICQVKGVGAAAQDVLSQHLVLGIVGDDDAV